MSTVDGLERADKEEENDDASDDSSACLFDIGVECVLPIRLLALLPLVCGV